MNQLGLELGLQLVRVTEAAALASAEWVGLGNKQEADAAAVDAMRRAFDHIDIQGTVVIGEGEMDEAPMLYIGEKVGSGRGPQVDIAVDPLEGTNLAAKDQPNAMAIFAVGSAGSLLHAPDIYMQKIAVGRAAAGSVHLDLPPGENAIRAAKALGKDIREFRAVVLDRSRHERIIHELRSTGARVRLISDGDVSPVLSLGIEGGDVDMVIGTGGAPEGVLAAAAIRCLGGDFQGRLVPENEQERERALQMLGSDPDRLLTLDELVKSPDVLFLASAITDSRLLPGVKRLGARRLVSSLLLSSSTQSRHFIQSEYPAADER